MTGPTGATGQQGLTTEGLWDPTGSTAYAKNSVVCRTLVESGVSVQRTYAASKDIPVGNTVEPSATTSDWRELFGPLAFPIYTSGTLRSMERTVGTYTAGISANGFESLEETTNRNTSWDELSVQGGDVQRMGVHTGVAFLQKFERRIYDGVLEFDLPSPLDDDPDVGIPVAQAFWSTDSVKCTAVLNDATSSTQYPLVETSGPVVEYVDTGNLSGRQSYTITKQGATNLKVAISLQGHIPINPTTMPPRVALPTASPATGLSATTGPVTLATTTTKSTAEIRYSKNATGKAGAELHFTGNPSDGHTAKIGGITYTFRTTPATAYEVLIGGTAAATRTSLRHAVNFTGISGTDYGLDTLIHPKVAAIDGTTDYAGVTAKTQGLSGNSIIVTEASTALEWRDSFYDAVMGGVASLVGGRKNAYPRGVHLTGTLTVPAASTNVSGTNTFFTREVYRGDEIILAGENRRIRSVGSDTYLVISGNHISGATGVKAVARDSALYSSTIAVISGDVIRARRVDTDVTSAHLVTSLALRSAYI